MLPKSINYSPECKDLLLNLLQYNIRVRLQGPALAVHPYLELPNQYRQVDNRFYREGVLNLSDAVKAKADSNMGEALMLATEAYIKFRVQWNLTVDTQFRKTLEEEYNKAEMLCCDASVSLTTNIPTLTPTISDDQFKKHLQSTPQLLNGFDIGCHGEMFLKEGQIKKALTLFAEAVNILLPLLKVEPLSERRNILGKRVEKWISYIEQNKS